MKQRYNELTHDLCVRAVLTCFDGKWLRNDVMHVVNKYGGVTRKELEEQQQNGSMWAKLETAESIAFELEQRLSDLMDGDPDALDLDPVLFSNRRDGISGKMRKIAYECVMHQLFNHLVILGMTPLLNAKLLPQQFASIPKKGQTGLAKKVSKSLNDRKRDIRHARKTDIKSAYASLQYSAVIRLVEKEIPRARWIIALLKALARMSPDGCLIIGGYLDAWLFNFAMSYALRHVNAQRKTRRGKSVPLIKLAVSFMDDFGICGSREADVNVAIKKIARYVADNFGLTLKIGKATRFLTPEAERRRRRLNSPAARGSPALDMGGYMMHRRYITIRKSIFKRLRRQYLRAWCNMEQGGTMPLTRAYKVVSYYGYFKHSDSRKIKEKLHVEKVLACAKAVVAYHARQKRKEQSAHEQTNRNAQQT